MYDVGIIGGGLGGLSLSILMADLGWKVLLIEKKEYPFHRVCGEYIAQESWDFLKRIGFDKSKYNLPTIDQLLVSAPNGNYFESDLDTGGIGISRFLIDQELYKIALEKGVSIYMKESVNTVEQSSKYWNIQTNKNNFEVKALVGAFGKRSNLDQSLHRQHIQSKKVTTLNNFVAVKYHLKGHFKDNQIELHNFEGGYCGLSKVENDLLCMCYIVKGTVFQKYGDIKKFEEGILRRNPFLNKYLDYERLWNKPLSIAQIDFSKKDVIENNIPLIGDAAGLIAPLCGNGMSMSMHSSVLLTPLLNEFLNGKKSWEKILKLYQKEWLKAFDRRIKAGRLLQQTFGEKNLTKFIIQILKNTPNITQKIISTTHGERF